MNGLEDPLSNLRGIHMPEPVSFWPPAIGWWLLVLLGIGLVLLGYWGFKYYFRPNIRKDAMIELDKLNQGLIQDRSYQQFYINVSILVRRIAITIFGRSKVAGLAGESWLLFLDETSGTTFFTTGNGRLLITAPYMSFDAGDDEQVADTSNDEEVEQFYNALKSWVVRNT